MWGRDEGDTHIWPVPKGSIKGLSLGQKQLLDVTQAGNLEHLWLFLDHLPGLVMAMDREEGKGKARYQRVRRHVWPRLVGHREQMCAGLEVLSPFPARGCRLVCEGGYLWRAEKRLLGDSRMGPLGRPQPRSLTHCK